MIAKFYTDTLTRENEEDIKRFILEINNHRIILSEPEVQLHEGREYKGIDDILYFYHNFEIEENKNYSSYNDEAVSVPDWQGIASVRVYEDSMTMCLGQCIDEILAFDIKSKSRRDYFFDFDGQKSSTDYECKETFVISGFCEEDNFIITKCFRHFDYSCDTDGVKECEYYHVFFGIGQSQLGCNMSGIYATLSKEDLLEVKKWATEFMGYVDELIRTNSIEIY